jgi:hypothetical protein
MPKYFKQSKLASFQRQLNLYGFTRLSASGPDKGGYFHELFLRGKEHMCSRIIRMKIKGPRVKGTHRDRDEPKFYKMKFLPSTPERAQDQRNSSALRTEASKSISMPNQETPLHRSCSASDNRYASSNFQHLESSSNMINLNDSSMSRMLFSDFPTNVSLLSYPTFFSFLAEEDNELGTEPLSWDFDLDLLFAED